MKFKKKMHTSKERKGTRNKRDQSKLAKKPKNQVIQKKNKISVHKKEGDHAYCPSSNVKKLVLPSELYVLIR